MINVSKLLNGLADTIALNGTGGKVAGGLPYQSYRINPVSQGWFARTVGNKSYELTDHLGNVRAVVSDALTATIGAGNQITTTANILSYTDYYPFGMSIASRSSSQSRNYRFGFNGKEKDDDITGVTGATYDYGFRIYDARVSRFLSVDPLSRSFPWNSTYAFAENDVIRAIDLEGKEKRVVIQETGANGKPITIKDYDIISLTGRQDPLGSGDLYIRQLQNKNITGVRYENFKNGGKYDEESSFSYRVGTEDAPQLIDYGTPTPPPFSWESDVQVGAKISDKAKVFGVGFEKTVGVSASLFYTNISTDGTTKNSFKEVSFKYGYGQGASGISGSYSSDGNLKLEGNAGPLNSTTESNFFDGSFKGSVDFKIIDVSEVKGIGGSFSLKYNPSRGILNSTNYTRLNTFRPINMSMHSYGNSKDLNNNTNSYNRLNK